MKHPLFIKFWENLSKKLPEGIFTEAIKEVALKAFEVAITADERDALAWMKVQAKALDSSVTDEDKVGDLARVISGHIHILTDKDCTCTADQYGCAENPNCIIHGVNHIIIPPEKSQNGSAVTAQLITEDILNYLENEILLDGRHHTGIRDKLFMIILGKL